MGGANKALLEVDGQPQLQRILQAMGEGFAQTLVSYNEAPPRDSRWSGLHWLPDLRTGFNGPLAGLETLLMHTRTPWLLTVPVDLARPTRLDPELLMAGQGGRVLVDGDGRQPLVALWPVADTLFVVRTALDRGERAAHAVLETLGLESVSIEPLRIGNLNTRQDLEPLK